MPVLVVKECICCGLTKPLSEFHNREGSHAISYCKICSTFFWVGRQAMAELGLYDFSVRRPSRQALKVKLKQMEEVLGINPIRFQERLAELDGKCPICQNIVDKLYADHNHTTGKFRDFICNTCNTAIGLLHEDMFAVLAVATYLAKDQKRENEVQQIRTLRRTIRVARKVG